MALDKFQQLVSECPIALAFLGNPKQGTLELTWVSPENAADFVQRGTLSEWLVCRERLRECRNGHCLRWKSTMHQSRHSLNPWRRY